MNGNSETKKPGGPTTSCGECQRRKQKCSREWPCNHCVARKVPHLCQFGPRKPATTAAGATEKKRPIEQVSAIDSDAESDAYVGQAESTSGVNDALRAMGYAPDRQGQIFGYQASEHNTVVAPNGRAGNEKDFSSTVPARPYADMLVRGFFNDTNYLYYALYPPHFLEAYAQWWTDRANGRRPVVQFTCLLLRVCACSAQFLQPDTQQRLEVEMGEDMQTLTERYHHAAQELSNTLGPGQGGPLQVAQLFLTASWYKAEAQYIQAWHALGSAIREAQELGMHNESTYDSLSEFDRELRRRMWCVLYMWDWFMSLLLARPLILNHTSCHFSLPTGRLEQHTTAPSVPNPITYMLLQCGLVLQLTHKFGQLHAVTDLHSIRAVRDEVETWFRDLPSVYTLTNPDTTHDAEYSHLRPQRWQLHTTGYINVLTVLKPLLTKTTPPSASPLELELRASAVEYCLTLIEESTALLGFMTPDYAKSPVRSKFHFAVFSIFDTAAILCSGLIHNKTKAFPQRERVIAALKIAMELVGSLARAESKPGGIADGALRKLVGSIPLSSSEKAYLGLDGRKRTKKDLAKPESASVYTAGDQTTPEHANQPSPAYGKVTPTSGTGVLLASGDNDSQEPNFSSLEASSNGLTPESWGFVDLEPFVPGEFGDFEGVDLGDFGEAWDWQGLNLGQG